MTDITKLKIYTYVKMVEMHIFAVDLVGIEITKSKIEILFSRLVEETNNLKLEETLKKLKLEIDFFLDKKIESASRIAIENKLSLFLQKNTE